MLSGWSKRVGILVAVLLVGPLVLAACGGSDDADASEPIVFADQTWESSLIHTRVAQFIVEHGYGYETDTIQGGTEPLILGLVDGEVDVIMEVWSENTPAYDEPLANGDIVKLGMNFGDAEQGWYVPTYVVEGDAERGIEPMAPDLKSVDDLPDYWELFKDPQDSSKGVLVNCMVGWTCAETNTTKLSAYGLDEYYNMLTPGSNTALAASLSGAYKKGEPWLGYYWEPTWVFAAFDLTKIEEPPATDECLESMDSGSTDVACGFSPEDIYVGASDDFKEDGPEEVVTFLENYHSTLDLTNAMLLYLEEHDATVENVAMWFLREHEETWTAWVPEDVAEKVKDALADLDSGA